MKLIIQILLSTTLALAGCSTGNEGSQITPIDQESGETTNTDATEPEVPNTSTAPEIPVDFQPAHRGTIPASDPYLRYIGRWDQSVPDEPRADWPGVRIQAQFTGTSVAVRLRDGASDYVAYIDGEPWSEVLTTSEELYPIASGLEDRVHQLVLIRKTEDYLHRPFSFLGLTLDPEAFLVPLPARSERRIEFIGASWTGGYGNESLVRECAGPTVLRETTNTDEAFGSLVARHFDAEPHFVSWSGKGMMRNYGSPETSDPTSFPLYYPRTLSSTEGAWDAASWIPQYVVIQLGGNDFSTEPRPSLEEYKAAYHAFLDALYEQYPGVTVILGTTQSGTEYEYKEVIFQEQIANKGRAGQLFHLLLNNGLSNTGCDFHPNLADHQIIAERLIEIILAHGAWGAGL